MQNIIGNIFTRRKDSIRIATRSLKMLLEESELLLEPSGLQLLQLNPSKLPPEAS